MTISSYRYVSADQRRRGNKAILLLLGYATKLAWLETQRKDARYWNLVTSREDARGLLQAILAEGELPLEVAA